MADDHVYQPVDGTNLIAMDRETHRRIHAGVNPHTGEPLPHPSRVTVSGEYMVTGLLPKCPVCPLAEGHPEAHAGVSEHLDVPAREARSQLLSGVARAYGAVPPSDGFEPLCGTESCAHEQGAHHGPNGEGRCGEDGCGCQRFQP